LIKQAFLLMQPTTLLVGYGMHTIYPSNVASSLPICNHIVMPLLTQCYRVVFEHHFSTHNLLHISQLKKSPNCFGLNMRKPQKKIF